MSPDAPFWESEAVADLVVTDDSEPSGELVFVTTEAWDSDETDAAPAPFPAPPSSLDQLWIAWRQPQFWRPYLPLLGLITAAILLCTRVFPLSNWQRVGCFAVLLALLPAAWRRSGLRLFGPMLLYDLIRTARRGRHLWFRCLYAASLLVMLYMVYTTWFVGQGFDAATVFTGNALPISEVPRFAESFLISFFGVQLLAVLVLTPVYAAGAIAEEKARGTLEFILATDLGSQEIVLGKLASRLASMVLLVLTGLPVLSLTLFLGGIDPNLLLAGFAVTLLTTLTLSSLSIYVSVRAARPFDAICITYFWTLAYLLFLPGIPLANWGNPLRVYLDLDSGWRWRGSTGPVFLDLLAKYATFHGIAALLLLRAAIRTLRSRPLDPPRITWTSRVHFEFPPRRRRPELGEWPLLWKELYADAAIGSNQLGRYFSFGSIVAGCLIVAAFAVVIVARIEGDSYSGEAFDFRLLAHDSNAALRLLGTILGMGMLLLVGLAAAGSVAGERSRQTLDSLLSTPVEKDHIVLAKWLGAILSVRSLGWFLGSLWLLAILTGGLQVFAVPLLVLAWLAQAAAVAALGVRLSVDCGSALRAMVFTVAALLAATLLPLLLQEVIAVHLDQFLPAGVADKAGRIVGIGLSPAATLSALALRNDVEAFGSGPECFNLLAGLFGILFYAVAALRLVGTARRLFHYF